ADYQKTVGKSEHPDHKRNPWLYNYVGKFKSDYMSFYAPGNDTNTGLRGTQLITTRVPTEVTFTPADYNPILANYTKDMYSYYGNGKPQTINDIRTFRGMLNGDVPQSVYGVYNNIGSSFGGYSYQDQDQYAVSLD